MLQNQRTLKTSCYVTETQILCEPTSCAARVVSSQIHSNRKEDSCQGLGGAGDRQGSQGFMGTEFLVGRMKSPRYGQ